VGAPHDIVSRIDEAEKTVGIQQCHGKADRVDLICVPLERVNDVGKVSVANALAIISKR
jgi:hypothetical protein